jgi:hypothetical protein
MPHNDAGEFELVLGNRQLLSVFFIVVVLLGVFFTMGYIVGRNTVPQLAAQRDAVEMARKNPIVVDPAGEAAARDPGTAQPAADSGPAEAKQPPPSKQEGRQTAETKAPPKPAVETPKPPPAAGGAPAAGSTFLQIAATRRNEADLLVEVLGKKGFRATTTPVPGSDSLLRVLVGPVDGEAVVKTRTDLEAIGFKPMLRKF